MGRHKGEMNSITNKMLLGEVTVNLNMFAVLMENIIVSYLDSTVIVTIDSSTIRLLYPHIL